MRPLNWVLFVIIGFSMLVSYSDSHAAQSRPQKANSTSLTSEKLHPKFDYYISILFIKYGIKDKTSQQLIKGFTSQKIGTWPLGGLPSINLDGPPVTRSQANKMTERQNIAAGNNNQTFPTSLNYDAVEKLSRDAGIKMNTLGSLFFDLEVLLTLDDISLLALEK